MMRFIPLFVLVPWLAACGSGDGEEVVEPGPEVDPLDFTFQTGDWEVPVGDVFECFYTGAVTDKDLAVRGAIGAPASGLHHVTVYYTDQVSAPEHHPCLDEEMINWHQIAGAGGEADAAFGLPDGLAARVPAGSQLVVQVHYINTTDAPFMRNDSVTLDVIDPAKVVEYANYQATLDLEFTIPAMQSFTSRTLCTVRKDTQAVLLLGHMHEWGKHFTLERLDADGAVAEVLYDEEWDAMYSTNPPVLRYDMASPLLLPEGTKLRQTCVWDNTETEALEFPREMCLSFMHYFPDDGERIVACVPETGD